jgi:hypothetical protein
MMLKITRFSSCLLAFGLLLNQHCLPANASRLLHKFAETNNHINKFSENQLIASSKSQRDREYRACRSRVHIGPNVHFGPNVFICGRRVS